MNPTDFSELLADIADEYIVSAAHPHAKPARWHRISAIAACLTILIAAAVFLAARVKLPGRIIQPGSPAQSAVSGTTAPDTDTMPSETSTGITSDSALRTETTEYFASEPSLTTAVTTSQSITTAQTTGSVTSVSNTERTSGTKATVTTEGDITTIAEKTTEAESEDITTEAQDCSYTDATYTEGTKSDSDDSLTSWVISCRTVDSSAETPDFDVHAVLYRDFIPDAVLSAGLQNADWKTNDCLIIRFQTTGYGNGLAEMIGGTGMLYGLTIIPPAAPVDFVKEYIIAVSVPKKLYHPASPDGINRWLCSDEPVPATDRMQCMLLRYDE